MKLADFDFSELEHYVDCLESSGDAAERERYAEIIGEIVDNLPVPKLAAPLVLEVGRFAAWGGTFEHVRREFATLAASHAGWSAAQVLQADQREAAAEHGRRGGRPANVHGAEWLRLFDELQQKNRHLSPTDICKRIAASWVDQWGDGRHWRTIARGVERARNAQ
jgi:hypothetical protein